MWCLEAVNSLRRIMGLLARKQAGCGDTQQECSSVPTCIDVPDARWTSFWSPVFGRFQVPGELFVLLGEAHLPKPTVDLAQGCV